MIDSNSILLYVADASASARFYARLLGQEPVEASPTFAMCAATITVAGLATTMMAGRIGCLA